MKEFHLVVWKQFEHRKLIDKQELINTESIEDGLSKIVAMNSQKRLTTTDYRTYNLTKLFKDNSLKISEDIKTE